MQHTSDSGQWHLVVTLHSLCYSNLAMFQSPYQLLIKHLYPLPTVLCTGSFFLLFLYSPLCHHHFLLCWGCRFTNRQDSYLTHTLSVGNPIKFCDYCPLVYLKHLETSQLLRTWSKPPNSTRSLLLFLQGFNISGVPTWSVAFSWESRNTTEWVMMVLMPKNKLTQT